MLLVRPLLNAVVPFQASTLKHKQQQKHQYRAPVVRGCVRLPLRFCRALEYLQVSHHSYRSRRQQFARVWAAKADTGKAESADSSGSKDKQRPDKSERADHKADSKTEAITASKPDSKPDKSKGSKTEKTEKADQPKSDVSATASQGLKPVHLATFFIILGTGLMFLAVLLWFTADIRFQQACTKVLRRLFKTVALRQVMGILGAMTFVRLGLEPMVKMLRRLFRAPGTWEKSSEFYILREVYRPLEFLFTIAAFTTLAENFLPQLIALPKGMIQNFVRSTLSLTFVIAAARVVFNIKARMARETSWQLELKGDLTKQRRVEAVDKLLSVMTLLVSLVFGLQAIGLDVNSVLAIGGVGGLAVGLAGREILENLFTGLIILSSSPFEVGDEVLFTPPTGNTVEGIVVDVGWYRTTIRSFEREIFNIPNSVFSRNVVLNITRKGKEWRFYEFIGLRVDDIVRAGAVVADMRKIIRQDPRIIQKLHRRVFLDKITRDQVSIYISCYVEAPNRDAFMAVKQDLLLAFTDCVERNGARLARNRLQIEVQATTSSLPKSRKEPETNEEATQTEAKALTDGTQEGAATFHDVSPDSPSGNGMQGSGKE
ncbi:MAG: small conductance mechanosensitive ion channel family, partial [Trebouxia sp. A1-2]